MLSHRKWMIIWGKHLWQRLTKISEVNCWFPFLLFFQQVLLTSKKDIGCFSIRSQSTVQTNPAPETLKLWHSRTTKSQTWHVSYRESEQGCEVKLIYTQFRAISLHRRWIAFKIQYLNHNPTKNIPSLWENQESNHGTYMKTT